MDAGPKRGRPSKKTPELCAEICERLAQGEPLAVMCREEHMPDASTVWDWTEADEDFSQAIARARKEGFDAIAAQCIEIADDESHDWALSKKSPIVNEVAIARARLRVETRLKLLAKWDPKRYGERTHTELSGPDGGPIQTETSLDISNLPDEQLRALAGIPIPPR